MNLYELITTTGLGTSLLLASLISYLILVSRERKHGDRNQ
jgi:hypothetical protein